MEQKPREHRHVWHQREWFELRDAHLIIRKRIACRCQKVRDDFWRIIPYSIMIDKRTKNERQH